jgi:hypothetical protein
VYHVLWRPSRPVFEDIVDLFRYEHRGVFLPGDHAVARGIHHVVKDQSLLVSEVDRALLVSEVGRALLVSAVGQALSVSEEDHRRDHHDHDHRDLCHVRLRLPVFVHGIGPVSLGSARVLLE